MRMKVHLFLNLFLKQQRFLFVGRTHRFNSNDLYYKILEPVYKYEPKSKKIKVEPEIKIKPEPVCKYETEVKIKQEAEQFAGFNVKREAIEKLPDKDAIDNLLKKAVAKSRLLEYELNVGCDFSFCNIF
jgi:hypothetical protein